MSKRPSLGNFFSQIVDRARESGPREPSNDVAEPMEGFICPHCDPKREFPEAVLLQKHYEEQHSVGFEAAVNNARAETDELRTKLKEEQYHSNELQKELDRLTSRPTKHENETETASSPTMLEDELSALQLKAAMLASENVELKAEVDELKGEKIVLQQQVAHRNSVDDAAVLRQELVQVHKMLDESNKESEAERDALQVKIKQLMTQLEERKTEAEDVAQEKVKENTEELEHLHQRVTQLICEVNEKTEMYEKAKEQCEAAQGLSLKHEKSQALLKTSLMEVQAEKSSLLEAEAKGKIELEEIQRDLDNHIQQVSTLTSSNTELSTKLNNVKNDLESERRRTSETHNSLTLTTKDLQEAKRELAEKSTTLQEIEANLGTSQKRVRHLEGELKELTAQMGTAAGSEAAIEQLNQEIGNLQKRIQDQEERATGKQQELNERIEEEKKMMQLEVEKGLALADQLQASESLISSLTEEKSSLKKELEQQREELTATRSQLNAIEAKLQGTQDQCVDLQGRLNHLEGQLLDKNLEEKSLTTKLENLQIQLDAAVTEKKNLQNVLMEKELMISDLESCMRECQRELDRVRIQAVEKREEYEELAKVSNDFSAQLDNTKKLLKESEQLCEEKKEQIRLHEKDIDRLNGSIKESERVISAVNEEKEKLETKLRETAEENSAKVAQHEEILVRLQASVEEKSGEAERLLREKEQTDRELRSVRNELEKSSETIETLKEEVKEVEANLTRTKEKMEIECSNLLASITDLTADNISLENDLKSSKEENVTLSNNAKQLHEKIAHEEQAKAEMEKRLEDMNTKHEIEMSALGDTLTQKDAELRAKERKVKEVQEQNDELMGKKLETDAKIASLEEEMQAALERLITEQTECEKLKAAHSKLKREYDDNQAALQEMGRENQTLILQQVTLQDRKWMDDSAVRNCKTCNKDFSLTLRKHHCRNCGSIFCNDCSSRTFPLASFPKPVRVCDSCYESLQNFH